MSLKNRLFSSSVDLSEEEAEALGSPVSEGYTFEVHPPWNGEVPATLDRVVKKILEMQTKWFKLRNISPVTVFEIRRFHRDRIRFQFTVPTKRLERKLRTGLNTAMPEISFGKGVNGIPVSEDRSIGGGYLSLGRIECFPLMTDFQRPPSNDVVASLHRDAMQDTGILIQILFKPVAGQPFQNWCWRKSAYRRRNYLRKEKATLADSRNSTPREQKQAKRIESKAGSSRFHTSIRFLVTGAGENTPSRVKELAGGYNRFESSLTGQYLDIHTICSIRRKLFTGFAQSVAERRFDGWNRKFQLSLPELAALVSLPDIQQKNISYSQP